MAKFVRVGTIAVGVGALAGILAVGNGVEVAGARRASCQLMAQKPSRRVRVLVRTADALVYRQNNAGYPTDYACWRPTGRRTSLILDYCPLECYGGRNFRVAGHFLAYEAFVAGSRDNGDYTRVDVIDLRSGKLHSHGETITYSPQEVGQPGSGKNANGIGATTTIVVNASGVAAWIANPGFTPSFPNQPGNNQFQVHALDAAGNSRLGSSPSIDSTSLRLAGRRLFWVDAGRVMTARLR